MNSAIAGTGLAFSAAQGYLARRIVGGMTLDEAAAGRGNGTASVHRSLDVIQARVGVLTLRAMSYRLLDREALPLPAVRPVPLKLDQDTRAVWEALRWDILDAELVPSLSAALGLPEARVAGVLDSLKRQFSTSAHGLIGYGIAHGVLRRGLDVASPVHTAVAATAPGEGEWDAPPSVRRALALRAGGRTTTVCATAEGVSRGTILTRLGNCQSLTGRRAHRALIHEGIRAGVLVRPDRAGPDEAVDMSDEERLVWQHLVLDVSNEKLPGEIVRQTGLSQDIVHRCLRTLRDRFGDTCAAVVQGWRHGVLCDSAPAKEPLRAPTDSGPALSARQVEALSLLTLEGLSLHAAAERMGISASGVDGHKRACANRAGVRSLRALTRWALVGGLLAPLDAGSRDPGSVPEDTVKVWGHLALDCPDAFLEKELANVTGLSRHRVHSCLKNLRSTGLTDAQLVAAGWRRQILDAGSSPPAAAEKARPVWQIRPPRGSASGIARRRTAKATAASQQVDPLGVLPRAYRADASFEPAWSRGRFAVCGEDVDFLWTDPVACRRLLDRIPAQRWGPVIGVPESGMTLLVTKAVPDRPVRRGPVWRFHCKAGHVELPPADARSGPSRYWVVPSAAPLWEEGDLSYLLDSGTGPGDGQ
ncbi:helix-turn-helix transcriptional regulator [Streptomyces sp. NPDC057682]|uniref:helix-turn-helix transcriptional regulator n=1 Tax=Streptomyces sp. NPDC057682 TaxID=3346210 RepID=UPI0036A64670